MRIVLLGLAAAALAGAAAAQPLPISPSPMLTLQPPPGALGVANQAQLQNELSMMRLQAQMGQQQQIGLQNQLSAQQAEQNTALNLNLLRQEAQSRTFAPVTGLGAPAAHIDLSQLASLPDASLAQSDANVRAAANNIP